jgi:RimJ/RimL family protein N-acetyltransferase
VTFHLKEVSSEEEELLIVLYKWAAIETEPEKFTCRPVSPVQSLDQYMEAVKSRIKQRKSRIFVLVSENSVPYGKITAFDYNPRNHSSEFGYYLPPQQRGQGYGRTMVQRFLTIMFQDLEWGLHKLYATTASGNIPSIQLLKQFGFHLDGTIREHYWLNGEIQDQLHFSLLKREFFDLKN